MSDSEEESLNLNSQNPMLINEIANRVLQFVPVAHLSDCRLVCKTWWKESLARWRRTQWLIVTTNDSDAGKSNTEYDGGESDLIEEEEKLQKHLFIGVFLNLLEQRDDPYQFGKFPFQKLHLFRCKLHFIEDPKHWKNAVLDRLCTKIGAFVRFLRVERCTFYTREDFDRVVFQLAPQLGYLSLVENLYKANYTDTNKLTNLSISNLVQNERHVQHKLVHLKLSMEMENTTPMDQLPLTWSQFFAHIPNLQKLELDNLDAEELNRGSGFNIFKSIHALRRKCGILQQLSELDLLNLYAEDLPVNDPLTSVFTMLKKMRLPLTFFAYDIGYEHNESTRLNEILKIGAASLETLIVYKGPFSIPFGDFPFGNSFPSLTKLTLVGPIVNDLRFLEKMSLLGSLRLFHEIHSEYPIPVVLPIPKVLGQLEKFKNSRESIDDVDAVETVTVVGNTDFSLMAHLTFPNLEEFIVGKELVTATQIEQLARMMPNVKRLRIGLNNDSFRALCEFWNGLEGLDAHPLMVDDEGITGIVDGGETPSFPNITDMKNLRCFGMGECLEQNDNMSEITDFSLEHGLLKMKRLESVSLWCSEHKMSDDSFEMLKDIFPPFPYSSIYRISADDDRNNSESSLSSSL